MYRYMAIANYEDRFVIPTSHREYAVLHSMLTVNRVVVVLVLAVVVQQAAVRQFVRRQQEASAERGIPIKIPIKVEPFK